MLLMPHASCVVCVFSVCLCACSPPPFCVQPEHEAFKQLLAAPQEEAKQIARRRFPVPKIVDCDQNGSQVCSRKGERHA